MAEFQQPPITKLELISTTIAQFSNSFQRKEKPNPIGRNIDPLAPEEHEDKAEVLAQHLAEAFTPNIEELTNRQYTK